MPVIFPLIVYKYAKRSKISSGTKYADNLLKINLSLLPSNNVNLKIEIKSHNLQNSSIIYLLDSTYEFALNYLKSNKKSSKYSSKLV